MISRGYSSGRNLQRKGMEDLEKIGEVTNMGHHDNMVDCLSERF